MSMILHGTRKPGRKLAAEMKRLGVTWPVELEATAMAGNGGEA